MTDSNHKYLLMFLLCALLIHCGNPPFLSSKFDCDIEKYKNTKSYTDINNNFNISIPDTWKTELYFSDYESEIFSADTTKELTESYILDVSYNSGRIEFDTQFYRNTDSVSSLNNLTIINSGNQLFQSKPTYWNIVKGSKNGFPFHQFNLMVKLSRNSYFNAHSEIYGDSAVYPRICKSISILESIEFFE